MNIQQAISTLIGSANLTENEMYAVMNQIMSGETTSAQIGSFLTALRMKGETVEEISAAVRVMREKVTPIETGKEIHKGEAVLDTCGTGGDGSGTFNVSTTCAFVAAAAGITVAKHGNRSVSSKCGSADVLEAAGVALDLTPQQMSRCVQEVGIGFLFAPALHGAMKYAIGPRKEMGVRTIFNVLGPLTNPAGANVQVLGVFDGELTEPLAEVLGKLGSKCAMVVHGEGNLDELTITGKTRISELRDGKVVTYSVTPEEFGLERCTLQDLKGGETADDSADEIRNILSGENGHKRNMVLLNAGAALYVGEKCESLQEGIELAAKIIDDGKALAKLDELVTFCKVLKEE